MDGHQHHIFQYGGRQPPLPRERPAWSPRLPPERKPSIFVVTGHGKPLLIPYIATWVERRPQPRDRRDWYPLRLPANYTAAGKTTANGAVIADDPGAAGEFVWSITISNVPANVTTEELTATLKVTAAGGQTANVTVTRAAGDSTIELDKETINLDVNGTQQTVNVTSNDSWTWARAAARTVLRMMGR